MTTTAELSYHQVTDRMLADPEALPGGTASVSFLSAFPITDARCSVQEVGLDWVPDRERAVVPDALTALCRSCAGREQCLLWAVAADAEGYWAGSTTADRNKMLTAGGVSVELADHLQGQLRGAAAANALHGAGEGSYLWYRRRGCRCGECREANAVQRAEERAKARLRADLAA
jgi:hypothetical protein